MSQNNRLSFTKKDFKIEWFSGTGSGGQHRNKTQNCVRITHIESGLSATGQSSRSRVENQRHAFKSLARKVIAYYNADPSQINPDRNHSDNIVRTYHFERNSASDGVVQMEVNKVMDGDLTPFIENAILGNRPIRKTGRV